MGGEDEKIYILVPVVVSATREYIEEADEDMPDDMSPVGNAAVRKILQDDELGIVGEIKSSTDIEDVLGDQTLDMGGSQ